MLLTTAALIRHLTILRIIWICFLVMFRAGVFRASGGLGLKSFGPRAGRAFLYRASGFFRAFVKYKIFLKSQKKSSKYIFKKIVIIYA